MLTNKFYNKRQSIIALEFSKKLILHGHNICSIFFYYNGVYDTNKYNLKNNNEMFLAEAWYNFHIKSKVGLFVCMNSAIKRNIVNKVESMRFFRKDISNLHKGFKFSSLEHLMYNIILCDKFIQF